MVKDGTQRWKALEDDFLKQHEGKSLTEIRTAMINGLGTRRSEDGIETRARFLGVKVFSSSSRAAWTNEELEILKRHHIEGVSAAYAVLQSVNPYRSLAAVTKKMQSMGLKDRRCPKCGKIWRPRGGRRICSKCANQKKVRARAKLRAEQNYMANFQSFSAPLDPWKSGEIPQRPNFRTPDPAWGF